MSDATQAMPPTEPPASGGGGADDFDDGDRRKVWMIVAGVLVLGLLVGVLIAVLAGGGDDSNDVADGSSTSSSSTTTSAPAASTTQATNAPTTAPTQAPATGPQITSLNASPGSVACTGTGGESTTVSWSTSNASQTTLSIDGPGIYGTYGPSGSVNSGPGCPPEGDPVSHSYTVTAKGPGGQTQKTINVQFHRIPGT
jgi:hypothetical protein